MLHATAQPATPIRPPAPPAPRPPATAAVTADGGLRVLVTDTPVTADTPHACTPVMAAWLIACGAAVALVDETGPDRRQWLHLRPAAPRQLDQADQADQDQGEDLVGELYAERFPSPRPPSRPLRTAASGATRRGGR